MLVVCCSEFPFLIVCKLGVSIVSRMFIVDGMLTGNVRGLQHGRVRGAVFTSRHHDQRQIPLSRHSATSEE